MAGRQAPERRAEIVAEALRHNADLRARVEAKIARLDQFLDGLDAKRQRFLEVQGELNARMPAHNGA
jgi:hypothetical protein